MRASGAVRACRQLLARLDQIADIVARHCKDASKIDGAVLMRGEAAQACRGPEPVGQRAIDHLAIAQRRECRPVGIRDAPAGVGQPVSRQRDGLPQRLLSTTAGRGECARDGDVLERAKTEILEDRAQFARGQLRAGREADSDVEIASAVLGSPRGRIARSIA